MPSLWGSKKKDDDAIDDDNAMARESEDSRREPTERDRLLPQQHRPPHADGYLDPDDPAVSPYNLWTVRFLRYISFLFLAITFVWWVLLLVSIFVSPPGLHTRGSGFFDFSYTTLSLGILLVSLLFFSAPSMAMRVCQATIAVILLIDLIVIVSVPRLRAEEGPPGIASVVWATLLAAWCVMVDRVVAWGKREEEERLTGRPETRRTLTEWLSVLAATVILAIYIVITILMTAALIIRSRDVSLEFEGQRVLVDEGRFAIHLACYGNTTTDKDGNPSPTLLLEGGENPLEYDFERFAYFAVQNKTVSRYCYWDRPGYAWSDSAPSPHSAGMSADNLAEALAVQGESGPWILVSAGYGSIVSRIFSSRNELSVAGMMLVDPLHEDLLYTIGSAPRGFVLWGWGVLSPLGIQRIIGALFNGQSREDRVYGRAVASGGKLLKARLQENLAATSFTKNEIIAARRIQSNFEAPLVVISSGVNVKKSDDWADKQKDLTTLTGNLIAWDVVNKAPHAVWTTDAGMDAMQKRLAELVDAGYRAKPKVEER